jgi:hypothetical protein
MIYLGETHGIGSSRSGHAVTKKGEVSQSHDPSLARDRQPEPGCAEQKSQRYAAKSALYTSRMGETFWHDKDSF